MNKKRLQIEQLDRKLKGFREAVQVTQPTIGWLKTVRVSIGMSLQQVADKLAITKQSVQEIEIREKEGSITLNSLKETANALDMQLVYGLVPKDGTVDDLIERKAKELALRIVSRTSNTMKLEDQENSKERIQKAIEERKAIIKNEMPKSLWD
ncbi:mobile mystery protein A [Gelidibacter salicanalis]|uniref:Mobile mystery protein A n=1 Tax=Gelidibacter salicanalis TaxID=291193 RepID=A0A5C7AGU3_9FLAO|nr:mobile mystery protein A [Gelidibacter salicanalis]TXE07910.1 mobile mystery protein A [Gelidibacter salicanalis]